MKILSAAEMQACDRATTEHFGIASTRLMRAAARAVASFAQRQFPQARRITVLCGRGNNGGDGLMAARLLADAGLAVTTLLLGSPEGLKGDAALAWAELLAEPRPNGAIHVVTSPQELAVCQDALSADLILDAIVGTGFQPPLRGLPLAAVEWLRASLAPILAVDLPSGWDADSTDSTAAPQESACPADAVVTFTAPKPAHVFGRLTRRWDQPIVMAPIGSPDEAIVSTLNLHWAGSAKVITEAPRPADSNKGMFGHVLVVGGSAGKSGAPAMTALAALRSGAGLVTAAVSPQVLPLVAGVAPELMTYALATGSSGQFSAENLNPECVQALLDRITVLAIGPGLGTSREAADFALGLLAASRLPAVVDADALNALAKQPERLLGLARGRTLVLTPHPGEMARLTGLTVQQVQSGRIRIAREFATRNGVTLVLKGWRTLVAHPDGSIAVNTTGNPAMAKGGSGDVLTGIVAALLAQHGEEPKRAVEASIYLHGLAADLAVNPGGGLHDQHTLLATDSLAYLSQAFRFRSCTGLPSSPQPACGYCWLQGLPLEPVAQAHPLEVRHHE